MSILSCRFRAAPFAAALLLSACAGAGPGASFDARDPYMETNRSIHDFNVALDRNVLRPVAQGYDTVAPALVQHMLGNAFGHLDTLNNFLNFTLQGEVDPAGQAFGRLLVNTVLGAGGLLDPASEFGLAAQDTDFGVTLGKYGVEEGAFLMIPFLGPSTTRDLGGRAGDMAMSPTTYIGAFVDGTAVDIALPAATATEIVDDRNRRAATIDEVLYESPDSYISLRAIYLQRRDKLILGEEAAQDSLPDIFDDEPAN